jgi:hypothetical protein
VVDDKERLGNILATEDTESTEIKFESSDGNLNLFSVLLCVLSG